MLEGKIVFFDLDGTLSEYRFNDRVGGGNGFSQPWSELLFGDAYLRARPLKTMINLTKALDPSKVYVLGAIKTNNEINQKYEWLSKNYPHIKRENIIFVCGGDKKVLVMEAFAEKNALARENMVLIDDTHATLRQVETAGFIAYHPTSFVE